MGEAYIIFQACLNESDIIYAVETMTRNLIKRDSRWTGNKAGRGLASLFMSLLFNPISGACRCFVFCLLSQVLLLTAPSGSSSMGASEIAATFRRGVPVVKRSLYNPNLETFACLDGSKKIPIQQVNDDYCDCRDGSDEPGTSACPQGSFYCVNMGYKPLVIPSSRVNDGICDCCDASDEWRGIGTCTNICNELGKVLRDELEKQMELRRQGWTKRLEYSAEGRSANEARVLKLEKLKASRESLKKERDDAENSKAEIEAREKEVKDSYEAAWDAMKTARRAELSQAAGEAAFKALDTSEDGMLVPTELLDRHDLDTDGNGELSPEEAKSLVGESGVDLIAFLQTVWPTVESKYRAPVNLNIPSIKGQGQPDTTDQHQEIAESDVSLRNPSMEEDSLDPPVVEADETVPTPSVQTLDSEEEHPDDIDPFIPEEPTEDFGDDVDSRFRDMEREVHDLEKIVALDLGRAFEFAPLHGKCLEFTDREYTYKLCPYDRVSQRNKNGGGETSLGSFTGWEDDRRVVMKYENGQGCWNGPSRSAKVYLSCGLEDQLTAVSEPSRCEYEYRMTTPAVCEAPEDPSNEEKDPGPPESLKDVRDEL